jgi:hypothetical protein
MMSLFDGGQHELEKEGPTVKLAALEKEKVRLMDELAELAKDQKRLVSEVRALEKEQKALLEGVEEHSVPEGQELTLQDVEMWCRSAFYNMAHTMASNPHAYFARKKVRRPEMYERVVRYVLDHGYPQEYGSRTYTVLDVQMHDGEWFLWNMSDNPSESEVLNLKPDSLRPGASLEHTDVKEGG